MNILRKSINRSSLPPSVQRNKNGQDWTSFDEVTAILLQDQNKKAWQQQNSTGGMMFSIQILVGILLEGIERWLLTPSVQCSKHRQNQPSLDKVVVILLQDPTKAWQQQYSNL